MHNFQIKKVFKSNKKFQRFRDFKRTAYDKFDYKLILLSQLTRELALYETRSQWNETNYDGESYFCKSEFSQSIIQNDTKVSYLNHSILVQKHNLMQSSLLISSEKLICQVCRDLDSYPITYLFGGVRVDIQNSMKIPIHSLLRSASKLFRNKANQTFFQAIIVFKKPSIGKKNLKFEVTT